MIEARKTMGHYNPTLLAINYTPGIKEQKGSLDCSRQKSSLFELIDPDFSSRLVKKLQI